MFTLIRRAFAALRKGKGESRLFRAYPSMKERAEAIQAARRAHRPVKHLIHQQQSEMLRALRGEN